MSEVVVQERETGTRSWWLRWPPSVDDAVLGHSRTVAWLFAGAMALGSALWFIDQRWLVCTRPGGCPVADALSPGFELVGTLALLAAFPLGFLVFARLRYGFRRTGLAVPFEGRRRLLEQAVVLGSVARRDVDALSEAYDELLSGRTFGQRVRIRADVALAWGWTILVLGSLLVLVGLLSLLGSTGAWMLIPVGAALAGAGWLALRAGLSLVRMASEAHRWEAQAVQDVLARVVGKLERGAAKA
jgi:hypothetical protein